jgi:AcrR family transcriptional regulator
LYYHGMAPDGTPVKRRKQAERRRATRVAVLDATVACLVQDGYAGTTTRRIAERAHVSPGALQHHFASKQELLAEAITHLVRRLSEELMARGVPSAESGRQLAEQLIDRLWEVLNGPLIEAVTELAVAARTDPSLRQGLADAQRQALDMIGVTARYLLPDDSAQPGFVDLISTVLATQRGIVLLGFVSPADRDAAWTASRRDLLDLVAAWQPQK